MSGKLIIFSAPSGAGKSTLVHHLLKENLQLEFSVSATSRKPRGTEQHGVDYYYLSPAEFRERIANNEFIEYEEVYPDLLYGTLRSEIDRISAKGNNIIFDVDVVGGLNIKKQFGERALAVFIAPPDIDELLNRLKSRGTDTPEMIAKRVDKAEFEMTFASRFDVIIVNDNLEKAKREAETTIREFIKS
ncbi:MAG: guanylate kinase [Bacteroidales bacterium]|nr:guanylate kinase [Bacteroidales bacterium]